MNKVRVLLAEGHQIVLYALRIILEPEFQVVGDAKDTLELIEKSIELSPDVLLMDISIAPNGGIEVVRELRDRLPNLKVVYLTMSPDIGQVAQALDAGVKAYVLNRAEPVELLVAVTAAFYGVTYVSPAIVRDLVDYYRSGRAPHAPVPDLTFKQLQLIQFLANGKSAREISGFLNIARKTVESRKYRLMQRLKLKNSAELVAYAVKQGLISSSS